MSTYRRRAIERLLLPWARLVLRRRRPTIIGITGSVGKTSTKDMLGCLFASEEAVARYGQARVTPQNLNSTAGVALSVLGWNSYPAGRMELVRTLLLLPFRALALAFIRTYPRVLVLECAAGPKSDIGVTAALAPPDVAIVTAIGPTHLEVFATEEGVARAKAPLVRHARRDGLVILGEDNPFLDWMEGQAPCPVARVEGRGRRLSEEITRAVGRHFGFSMETVDRSIEGSAAVPGRLSVREAGDVTIINDAFNANPLSMRLGLDTLSELAAAAGRRRVAVLGAMAELGERSAHYHAEIGRYARERADVIIGVGADARAYDPDVWCADRDEGLEALRSVVATGDVILVKGSNSLRMGGIARRLKSARSSTSPDVRPDRAQPIQGR